MAGEWLGRLANFENLNIVLLLNFIFVSENHISVVAVYWRLRKGQHQDPHKSNIATAQTKPRRLSMASCLFSALLNDTKTLNCFWKDYEANEMSSFEGRQGATMN